MDGLVTVVLYALPLIVLLLIAIPAVAWARRTRDRVGLGRRAARKWLLGNAICSFLLALSALVGARRLRRCALLGGRRLLGAPWRVVASAVATSGRLVPCGGLRLRCQR